MKSVSVTNNDPFCLRISHSQVRDVRPRFSTADNHDSSAAAKLLARFKIRGVYHSGDMLYPFNTGNVWLDVESRTHGDGIAVQCKSLIVVFVCDSVVLKP